MSDDNKKKRHPKSEREGKYPYVDVDASRGGHEVAFFNEKDKEHYYIFHPGGTYTEVDKNGRKISITSAERYSTTSQGKTESVEGPHDKLVGGGTRRIDWGGHHQEIAEDLSVGMHGQYIRAVKGNMFRYSTGPTEHCSEGGHFNDHNDGDQHDHSKGDWVQTAGENAYLQSGKDLGIYAQGNWDFQADKKARVFSKQALLVKTDDTWSGVSKKKMSMQTDDEYAATSEKNMSFESKQDMSSNAQNITITAETKLTLKVGGSSITIESGKITIKSASIEFQQG